jgi:hypothetical protein
MKIHKMKGAISGGRRHMLKPFKKHRITLSPQDITTRILHRTGIRNNESARCHIWLLPNGHIKLDARGTEPRVFIYGTESWTDPASYARALAKEETS